MTASQLAKKLNGSPAHHTFTKEEIEEMKSNGLVVVFPVSDDQLFFQGAIMKGFSCFFIRDFYFTKEGIFKEREEDRFFEKYGIDIDNFFNKISIDWNECDLREITTKIPHTQFTILEDVEENELYGFGIVFSINDLK